MEDQIEHPVFDQYNCGKERDFNGPELNTNSNVCFITFIRTCSDMNCSTHSLELLLTEEARRKITFKMNSPSPAYNEPHVSATPQKYAHKQQMIWEWV